MTEPYSFPDAVRRVEESTVKVSSESSTGVGFHLGHGEFVTARHVVEGYGGAMLRKAESGYNVLASVIGMAGDVALLQVRSASAPPPGAPLEMMPDQELQPGATVALVGYAFGTDTTVTRVVARRTTTDDTRIEVDAEVSPDLSGAPVIDSRGRVVGMVVAKPSPGATSGQVLGEPSLSRLLREVRRARAACIQVVASHSAIQALGNKRHRLYRAR